MESSESNLKPAAVLQPAGSSLILKSDYRREDFEWWPRPSEMELATLAARLARNGRMDAKRLVAQAWDLYWESCRRLKEDAQEVEAYEARLAREDELSDPETDLPKWVPVPKKYPLTHREVEALLLPRQKGRTAERASLIREFIFSQLLRSSLVVRPQIRMVSYWEMETELLEGLRERNKDEVARQFERYRKTVFTEEAYSRFAVTFLTWHRRFIGAKKAAAARKRWDKTVAAAEGHATQRAPGERKKSAN